MMKLASGFEILFFSDLDYQEMTVLIKYGDVDMVQLIMDKGVDNVEAHLLADPPIGGTVPLVQLNDLLDAIAEGKRRFACRFGQARC